MGKKRKKNPRIKKVLSYTNRLDEPLTPTVRLVVIVVLMVVVVVVSSGIMEEVVLVILAALVMKVVAVLGAS